LKISRPTVRRWCRLRRRRNTRQSLTGNSGNWRSWSRRPISRYSSDPLFRHGLTSSMPIRIAAIEVGHWHSLFDAAYLKSLTKMPDVQLAGIQDPDSALVAQRAAQLGGPPVFTDYREMLAKIRPDFVIALGRHSAMAGIAHFLLDEGYPFLMEKPMGINAKEVRGIADKAMDKKTFAAVPLFQRYHPFVSQARRMLADRAFGPASHFHFRSNRASSARYVSWGSPWMLDPAIAGGGCLRNIGLHGIDLFLHLTGEQGRAAGPQLSWREGVSRGDDGRVVWR